MSLDAPEIFKGRRLVVFGAGYVGMEVIRQAVARGLAVTALTRNPVRAKTLDLLGATTVVADLAADVWHAQIPPGAHYILNCVSSGGGGLEGCRRSYLEGMRSVLAWAQGTPGGTLVYTSSTSVYPQDGGVRVDETAPTDRTSEAGQILLEAERLGTGWPGRSFVLRLAGIYGPERHHLLDQLRAGSREVAGRGDHHLNLIYRDDIVDAIWRAFSVAEEAAGGVFNVADDGAAPKAEVIAWLAERISVEVPRFTGVAAVGRRAVTPDRIIANDRIKRTLGWHPRHCDFRSGYAAILGA